MLCFGWRDYSYDRIGDLSLGVMHRNADATANPDPAMRYLIWIKSHETQRAMLAVAVERGILHRASENPVDSTYLIEIDRLADLPVLLRCGAVMRIDECIRDGSESRLMEYFWLERMKVVDPALTFRRPPWKGNKLRYGVG